MVSPACNVKAIAQPGRLVALVDNRSRRRWRGGRNEGPRPSDIFATAEQAPSAAPGSLAMAGRDLDRDHRCRHMVDGQSTVTNAAAMPQFRFGICERLWLRLHIAHQKT